MNDTHKSTIRRLGLSFLLPAALFANTITVTPETTFQTWTAFEMSFPDAPSVELATTLSANVKAGSNTAAIAANDGGLQNGTVVYVYGDGTNPTESNTISSGGGTSSLTFAHNWSNNHNSGASVGTVFAQGQLYQDPNWPNFRSALVLKLVNELGVNGTASEFHVGTNENSSDYFTGWVQGSPAVAGTVSHNTYNNARYTPVNDDGNPELFCGAGGVSTCDPGAGNYPRSFPLTEPDYELNGGPANVTNGLWEGQGGMRAAIAANGNAQYMDCKPTDFAHNSSYLDSTPAEFAEHLLAIMRHLTFTFGHACDFVDMVVEPDNVCNAVQYAKPVNHCVGSGGVWETTKLGNIIYSVKSRLFAAGYTPKILCCSTVNAAHAVGWYTAVKEAVLANGAPAYGSAIDELTFHPYSGWSAAAGQAIAAQASADGIPTGMTEYDMGGVDNLFEYLENANISRFRKFGGASVLPPANANSTDYVTVTDPVNFQAQYVSQSGEEDPAWFFAQVFHYVQAGAVREGARSDTGLLDPVCFRNKGLDTCAIRVLATGNVAVNVTGASPGTYGCTYTYNNAVLLQPCPGGAQVIPPEGGTLKTTLPSVPGLGPNQTTNAVVTFYGMAAAATPQILQSGTVPIYSPVPVIQPGSWISIYGKNLASGTTLWNGNFPESLGDVSSVTINNKPGYLWYVSSGQINMQAPDDTATGPVSVVVNTAAGTAVGTVTLAPYGPSFTLLEDGKHVAGEIATPDGSGFYGGGTYDLVGPTGAFPFRTRPVKPGETLTLYGVGFGPTTPPVPAGRGFSGIAKTNSPVTVTIGGVSAPVSFAGITEAGTYQINMSVPQAPSGDQQIRAAVNGVQTPAGPVVTVQ
jgi:uncharacterized protein (TIGR03437 family)